MKDSSLRQDIPAKHQPRADWLIHWVRKMERIYKGYALLHAGMLIEDKNAEIGDLKKKLKAAEAKKSSTE